ncbi:hypothetical protein WMF20_13080 [Sorangium sp. So ce834]|uniref:hypothetical protein n=1 Tax=Sorangium sp. So ce834 TaxID=3133321 RepID=UPI003F62D85A
MPGHPLNPEAGSTPVPDDPREVAAALRAGELSLGDSPYYGFRYGERGRRFTGSDSAFLVTLATHTRPVVERQIRWLAGLLSNRGMPSVLLERHLRVLHRTLCRAIPRRAASYERLLEAAELLREVRRAHLPDEVCRAISRSFAREAGLPPTRLALGTGWLLAGAVADERSGARSAVASVASWFTDPELFPPAFVAAVHRALSEARAAARPGPAPR